MKKNKNVLIILGILFGLNVLAWVTVYDLSGSQFLEVFFFDVGQGDAIFIESPQGHQILIDGGPNPVILEKLGKEMPFWDRTIDLVVLTHPEHDHIAGLIEVLKSYTIENILWTGVKRDTSEYEEWIKLIEVEGAEIFIAKSGQKIICPGSYPGPAGDGQKEIVMKVLYPFESLEGKEVKNTNNTSVIVRLVFNENSFLFTGDSYKSVEKKLMEKELNLDSNVLKVGHHGSKTSSDPNFIEKIGLEIAVISVGENKFGHPHQETLATLDKYDIRVLRTDKDGDIKIISDGKSIKLISNIKN